ncbi:Endonuclease/exonuclease/phosphatase, partial [Mycena haematopus]
IKLSAINVNGRRKRTIKHPRHKWHDLHRIMFDERIGVLVVGETHLSAEQAVEIQESPLARRMEVYNSPFPDDPNTKGIAIVLNRELTNTVGVKIHYLIPGRAILAVLPWHGRHTLTVLGLYAPAESMQANRDFWDELCQLYMTLDLPVPDWCGGDWNIVEDPIDRLPHRPDEPTATAALARFKRLLELKDGWRNVNPDTKAYTYTSTHRTTTHSRIDRICVSPQLFNKCRNWTIDDVPGKLTDHRMVSVMVSAPHSPFIGLGRYALPLFLMKDREFLQFAVAEGAKAEGIYDRVRTDTDNIQITFKTWKETSLEFGHSRATTAVGALEQKKRKLQQEREDLLDAPMENQDSTADKLAKVQRAIDVLVSRQRERNRKETQLRCRTELDKITKFTVRMSKDRKPRDTLSLLCRNDVSPAQSCRRSDKMAELARDYHNDLQKDDSEEDQQKKSKDIEDVLGGMESHAARPEMADLAKELVEDDVEKALKQSANGTAAGLNGLPTEFWKTLHSTYLSTKESESHEGPVFNVVKFLTRVYNDIERYGVVPGTEFAKGWMCPIWKKKDPTDIANYRPITVLNTDYKIFTKALANKL